MPTPKQPNPPFPPNLLAELLTHRPYIEHLLCNGSRERHLRSAAQDQVQTVLRKAVQHLPYYRPHKEGIRRWLTRIVRNHRIDMQRRAVFYEATFGHDHVPADRASGPGPSLERQVQARLLLHKVFAHIEELPHEMQVVLILAALHEDPHVEIAAHFRIKEGAAKMRLSRARQMLRKRAGALCDHFGTWFFLILRRFFGQASHIFPPVLILFGALPQLEQAMPMPAESVVVPEGDDEPAPHVRDERHAVNVVVPNQPVVQRANGGITPKRHPSMNVSVDKPRRPTQANHDFEVVLPPSITIVNGRE